MVEASKVAVVYNFVTFSHLPLVFYPGLYCFDVSNFLMAPMLNDRSTWMKDFCIFV